MKIEELISGIKRQEIVVPEFQREFVWGANRAKDLIRSLLSEYPIGGILIWKTDNPPQLKGPNFDEPEGGGRTYQVLLDGQQRSTAPEWGRCQHGVRCRFQHVQRPSSPRTHL